MVKKMQKRPNHPREQTPFITTKDTIFIERGGGTGYWQVASVRYKSATSSEIELVLRRGSMAFKTTFNRETMRVGRSDNPPMTTFRDIEAPEKASFRPKPR